MDGGNDASYAEAMHPALGDHTLALPSGRTVGYSVYGDVSGYPVLNCHGGLLSGHDVGPADVDARDLGLLLISPDRPGVSRTDRLEGHGMSAWVRADVAPLLDHLGVGSFAAMGWSEGGQYALAAAFAMADRVSCCAVIAGCPPLDEPDNAAELNGLDRFLTNRSRRSPWAARAWFSAVRAASVHAPGLLVRGAVRGLPSDEARAVVERGTWLAELLGEGARNPSGGVDQYLALSAPWGFAPEEVAVPVRIFQGTADALVPEGWAQQLVRRIPGASVRWFPGEGHFVSLTRRREVLQYIAQTVRS